MIELILKIDKDKLLESINEHFPEIAYRYVSAMKLGEDEWLVSFKDFNPDMFEEFCMYCGEQWRRFGHKEECPIIKKSKDYHDVVELHKKSDKHD